MLDPGVAQEVSDTISAAIGHNVLITDSEGVVIGSGDVQRVGSFHEASLPVIVAGAEEQHDKEAASRLAGVQPGMTLPLILASRVVGTVGITGPPSVVRPFGEIVRAQTETMLRGWPCCASARWRNCWRTSPASMPSSPAMRRSSPAERSWDIGWSCRAQRL